MDAAYYQTYYRFERDHWWFRAREQIVVGHVGSLIGHLGRPLRILNVGVATGRSSEVLARFGTVVSIEYDRATAEVARSVLGATVLRASIAELPCADCTFDLVCALDVLEHVENDRAATEELKRVCAPGGFVCVTTPAFQALWSHHDEVNHHLRRYYMRDVERLFASGGTVVYSTYFTCILFPALFAFRVATRMLPNRTGRGDAGSDFTVRNPPAVERLLYRLMLIDASWISHRRRLPFGASLLLSWQKA
jgi:SAM-dependent methyltransferase